MRVVGKTLMRTESALTGLKTSNISHKLSYGDCDKRLYSGCHNASMIMIMMILHQASKQPMATSIWASDG